MEAGITLVVARLVSLRPTLVDVINLPNALFHGSITPNEQHNEIFEPAYHIVMRFVRCTI